MVHFHHTSTTTPPHYGAEWIFGGMKITNHYTMTISEPQPPQPHNICAYIILVGHGFMHDNTTR
jgi:hypothetical protein